MKRVPPAPGDPLYHFGEFVADATLGYLHFSGDEVPLPPRAFGVLLVLIRRAGQVVDKEELFKEVWPGLFVEENNLARQVSLLRKTLRQVDDAHEYIATVPGRGYRFIAETTVVARSSVDVTSTVGRASASYDPAWRSPAGSPADGAAVDRWFPGVARAAAPRRAPWQVHRGRIVAAVLVIAGAAAILNFPFGTGSTAWQPRRAIWQLTTTGVVDTHPAWSPDGRSVAYASERDGNLDIWSQPIGGGIPVQLTSDPAADWQPTWSPDGKLVAFRSDRDGGGIFVVPAAGGDARQLTASGYHPRWAPDGSRLLVRDSSSPNARAFLVARDGGPPRRVRQDVFEQFGAHFLAWHPRGRSLSVYGNHAVSGWSFWSVPLDDGPAVQAAVYSEVAERLDALDVRLRGFSWSPAGDHLFFEGESEGTRNLWRISVDTRSGHWIAGPDRLTTSAGVESLPAVSPTGRQVAFSSRSERTRVWSLPFDVAQGQVLGAGEPISSDGSDTFVLDVSADGRQLSYRAMRRGREELWVRSLDRQHDRLVTFEEGAQILQPRWSTDGVRLAYLRANHNSGDASLVLLAPGMSDEKQVFSASGSPTNVYDWFADGTHVLIGCRDGSAFIGICAVPVSGARPGLASFTLLASDTSRNLFAARSSPDQRWIAFVALAGGAAASSLYVMPAGGGDWLPVAENEAYDDKPRWSPDGSVLFFLSNRSGFWNVWARRWDGATGRATGQAFPVTRFRSFARAISGASAQVQYSVVHDWLVLPISESAGAIWVLDDADR